MPPRAGTPSGGQDVLELLDAGIEVYTTVNVQHLESLNDVIAQVTGVVVRETVPDSVLEGADEVELIDLPVEDLRQRLKEGNVYVPEQALEAVRNFFREGNLIALRELALRHTAESGDRPGVADAAALRAGEHHHGLPAQRGGRLGPARDAGRRSSPRS